MYASPPVTTMAVAGGVVVVKGGMPGAGAAVMVVAGAAIIISGGKPATGTKFPTWEMSILVFWVLVVAGNKKYMGTGWWWW